MEKGESGRENCSHLIRFLESPRRVSGKVLSVRNCVSNLVPETLITIRSHNRWSWSKASNLVGKSDPRDPRPSPSPPRPRPLSPSPAVDGFGRDLQKRECDSEGIEREEEWRVREWGNGKNEREVRKEKKKKRVRKSREKMFVNELV